MNGAWTSVLAFDFGTKRIGVAAGQTVTATASPVATISARRNGPDWNSISVLIETWAPDALVVGMPLNQDGTDHELAPSVRGFIHQLRGRYGLPVHTIDERLSSYEAQDRINGGEGAGLDAVAAQVILETWFSSGAGRVACPWQETPSESL